VQKETCISRESNTGLAEAALSITQMATANFTTKPLKRREYKVATKACISRESNTGLAETEHSEERLATANFTTKPLKRFICNL
jgi:hypothetical protein